MYHEKKCVSNYPGFNLWALQKCIWPPTSNEESSQPWLFPQAYFYLTSGQPSNVAVPQPVFLAEMTSY